MDNRLTSMIEHIFFFYCKYTQHVSYVARELQQLLPRKVSNVMDIESRTPTICNYCSKLVNKHLLCRSSLQSNQNGKWNLLNPVRMASGIWRIERTTSTRQTVTWWVSNSIISVILIICVVSDKFFRNIATTEYYYYTVKCLSLQFTSWHGPGSTDDDDDDDDDDAVNNPMMWIILVTIQLAFRHPEIEPTVSVVWHIF